LPCTATQGCTEVISWYPSISDGSAKLTPSPSATIDWASRTRSGSLQPKAVSVIATELFTENCTTECPLLVCEIAMGWSPGCTRYASTA
jgi:hypothetical protein